MRLMTFRQGVKLGLACKCADGLRGSIEGAEGYPGSLLGLIDRGRTALDDAYHILSRSPVLDRDQIIVMPPIPWPPKIICIGLNYADHTAESPYEQPSTPTLFARYASSLVGHSQAIIRPRATDTLDYEGELAVIIGRGGRHILRMNALAHVAGYSIFNDCTVREYARRTTQWTLGKNFDQTGSFGPFFVSSDELPPGASGLQISTRLNGMVVQGARTSDMIFDVPALIEVISEVMTLEPGDVIVSGTPGGMGGSRKPPLYMRHGDVCEVEIEGIGTLRNRIADEGATEEALY